MVTNFRGKTYEEKLAEAGMTTLEERRKRGDLLQAYRVLNKVDDVDPSLWFTMARQREDGPAAEATRQSAGFMNIKRGEERQNEIRKNFWSQRVIDPWNKLPDEVKQAETLNAFKNGVDNLRQKQNNLVHGGQRGPH